jgi:hypothetical protein
MIFFPNPIAGKICCASSRNGLFKDGIQIDTFDIQPSQWVMTSSGYYKYVYTDNAITQQIVDHGVVNVYLKDFTHTTNYNQWFGMPDVVAGQSGFRFSYYANTVIIYADDWSNGVPRPFRFKVVILI